MFIKKLMVFTKTNPIKGICYNYVIFDVSLFVFNKESAISVHLQHIGM